MLVLSRKVNEKIIIGDSIVLTVVAINGGAVRVGIEAPREISVLREELLPEGDETARPRHESSPPGRINAAP